ncbi:TniQ family protein [Tritonibacter mobilis]|uniref:TniQ family protein n=1 Tax=Tritonibacter mobilis TaxID=379347 RepID=UPI001C08848D|nr:TniQ family protein [Tritonibacter mobilis]MBU3033944.1 TniQ family protein [Tritonibacter mobilis]WHQ84990.1 TniQ family protein [Tritonibacter mobilis]
MMFSTVKPLPLNVKYHSGESATSLASRLAQRNGVSGMAMFLSDFGIDYLNLTNGNQEDCARLAALAGVDQAELHRNTPALVSPGWFRLGQEEIKFTAFTRTALKGCPQCLQDASHKTGAAHFGLWQLTSIRTCCLHSCYLTPLPTSPGTRERFDVTRLTYGFSPPEPQIANDQDLLFEHYLRNRIEKGPGKTWLDRLPFHVAAQTCEGFGLLLTLGPKARREVVTPAQWAAAGTVGFSVLRRGPDAFRQKLKDIQQAHPIDNTLYRTRYRVFFEWLRHRDDDPQFDVIRDLVREFIFRNFPISEGSIVLGQPCPEQYVHSLSTARSRYGMSGWKLARRLASMGLTERKVSGKGFILKDYVPTKIINDITTDFGALLNATDAGKYLGIERFMMAKLTQPGLVEKYFDEKNASPMYHPRDLDGFIGKLKARVERSEAENLLDIATASHRVRIPTERVVEIILRNRLPLHAVDPVTARFPDFRVSLDVLREVIATDHHGTVRPTRAAKILGINIRTIRSLMNTGVLKSCDIKELKSGRMRRYVCAKSIEHFSNTYVSVVELAGASGRLPSVEAVIQLDRGKQPLSLDPRANMIFRRSDVL